MRVAVSVLGRFHAFDLARELHRAGCLEQCLTSYPRFAAARFGVPRERVRSLLPFEGLTRAWLRSPKPMRALFDGRLQGLYARSVGHVLPQHIDLLTSFSGSTLEAIEPARRRGARVVIERGSAHIQTQSELLTEAYAELGLRPRLPHPRVVDRELAEYALADAIAVPSRFAARSFAERGFDPDRILVAPYGVDLSAFSPAERPAPGRRVLFVGQASVQKGTHHLVRAFEAAAPADAELWLVGGLEPELEPHVLGRPRVRWLGPMDQSDLPDIYRQCHVFCLPSIQDGFGMVLTQAAASGLPIVASTHSGGPEVIDPDRTGALIEPGDVDGLAAALSVYLEQPDLAREHGAAAALEARERWSWSRYGRDVHAAYTRLLGPNATIQAPSVALRRSA